MRYINSNSNSKDFNNGITIKSSNPTAQSPSSWKSQKKTHENK